MPTERRLLDADTAGPMYGLTPRQMLKLARQKQIPFVKIGRAVRFEPDRLDAWVASQRHDATA